MSWLDVLRISAVERTVWNIVRRDDGRLGEARLGAQGKAIPGFAAKYGVDRLVWYEPHASMEAAFVRERQIKKWKREWKIQLIEADLYPSIAL